MSVRAKAELFVHLLVVIEALALVLLVGKLGFEFRWTALLVTTGLVVMAYLYPRCLKCGKNPWLTARNGRIVYRPRISPEKVCSKCGTDLQAANA